MTENGVRVGISLYKINPEKAGGVITYALSLLKGLYETDRINSYYLLVSKEHEKYFISNFKRENFKTVVVTENSQPQSVTIKLTSVAQNRLLVLPVFRPLYYLFEKAARANIIKTIDALRLDVVYTPTTILDPVGIHAPQVVSMHDIQHVHFPEFFTYIERARRETTYQKSASHAAYIQASSEYVRDDFIKHFKCSPSKVILIRDGVDPVFKDYKPDEMRLAGIRKKYNLPEKFVFYPAQHWIHKNHITVVKAAQLIQEKEDIVIPVVLTGTKKPKINPFYESITPDDKIVFLGNIDFEDLPDLYRLSTVMCMPSLHESNSLPVLEALAVGTATLAADIEPNIELNTNNAITIFEQKNTKDLAEKMLKLWNNEKLRKEKIELGFSLADRYSWEQTAREYILLFKNFIS